MTSKLRVLSVVGGAYLLLSSAWASARYGVPLTDDTLVRAVGTGVAVLLLPTGAAYATYGVRRALGRWRAWRGRDSRRRPFVTSSPLDRPDATLDAIESTLSDGDRYDEVRREEFSEGPGLTIVYSTYHTMFVRTLASGRLLVNGDSHRVDGLVETVDAVVPPSLERTSVAPDAGPASIRGIPRAALAVCLAVLVVTGTGAVAGAAYPSSAYNPAERTVLAAIDLRGDLDPTTSPTRTRLSKAAFLADVLDEKSVEIAIVNSTEGRARHARDALVISDRASQLLTLARQSSSPERVERVERIERIEATLDDAEREVAAVLTEAIEASNGEEASELRPVRNELRRRANASSTGEQSRTLPTRTSASTTVADRGPTVRPGGTP